LFPLNKKKMKTIQFIAAGILLFCAGSAQSQVSVNVNIGSPPLWGPVGYSEARYYYLPDVQAYYDVQSSMFIYYGGGRWVHRTYLPSRYRNYDLYGGYKVVMSDYHGNTPYTHFKEHKSKYGRGYHGDAQRTIGERPGRGNQSPGMSHDRKPTNHGMGKGNRSNQKRAPGHGGNKGGKR
jgi:hypothetical protein